MSLETVNGFRFTLGKNLKTSKKSTFKLSFEGYAGSSHFSREQWVVVSEVLSAIDRLKLDKAEAWGECKGVLYVMLPIRDKQVLDAG